MTPLLNPPKYKPQRPNFSCGPTVKRPGWTVDVLQNALIGRSHRTPIAVARIQELLQRTRTVLQIPSDYQIAMISGSATAAIEMLMWNLLGAKPVDALVWDVFGNRWYQQMLNALKIEDLRCLNAPEGSLPNLQQVDFDRDVVFTWNGSTSGVCVPNGQWIDNNRRGLTICDATSATFAMDLDWQKLDATAFSWQKGLGAEPGYGMVVLSPRAVERLENHQPLWPIPGLFRLRAAGQLYVPLFQGMTLNTVSMLCVDECLDALRWAENMGGLSALIQRSQHNLQTVANCLQSTPWLEFLAKDPQTRASTTICFRRTQAHIDVKQEWSIILKMAKKLEGLNVAYDCYNHTGATPAFRIWGGPTVDSRDIICFFEWLDWINQIN